MSNEWGTLYFSCSTLYAQRGFNETLNNPADSTLYVYLIAEGGEYIYQFTNHGEEYTCVRTNLYSNGAMFKFTMHDNIPGKVFAEYNPSNFDNIVSYNGGMYWERMRLPFTGRGGGKVKMKMKVIFLLQSELLMNGFQQFVQR